MQKQIILIHGGDPFETYEEFLGFLKDYPIDFNKHGLRTIDWQGSLGERLGKDFQVVRPEMPSKRNAKYSEWKIWFEKFIPFFQPEVILIGSSLGGTFVAKYLAENNFPKKVKAAFLIAGAFEGNLPKYTLADFALPENLEKLNTQAENIFLYHSKDDNVVPFDNLTKFQKALPKATVRVFEDREHFNQEELPELIEDIRSL